MHQDQTDCAILQNDLNNLAAWEKKWDMAFYPEKWSAIRVTRSRKPISSTYTLKGHNPDLEDFTRYFGVELQSSMSWNRHTDQAVKKANITLGFLCRNLRISNEQTKTAAYILMVRPIIEYCSTVWTPIPKSTSTRWRWFNDAKPDTSPAVTTAPVVWLHC